MPEQQAWSSVSVCLPPPTLSPFFIWLDPSHFPHRLPLFFPPTLSFPLFKRYLSLIFAIAALLTSYFSDKCILVFHSFTQSSFPSLAILFVLSILRSSPVAQSPLRLSFLFFCPCSSFPELFLTLYPFVFKEWKRGKRWKKGRWRWRREKGPAYEEERETSKREETKSSLLSLRWEKMSEGAIIKLEFFNTVKNGALTA